MQEMTPREPPIQINGRPLTEAQAMAVRVAVTNFYMETFDPEIRDSLGPIAFGYRARLGEVLEIILGPVRSSSRR
jgi:hypothetical protein